MWSMNMLYTVVLFVMYEGELISSAVTFQMPAISFAFEKAEGDLLIMKRRPRNVANDRLVNHK